MHSHYCENLHDCQLITLVLCLIVNESNNIGRSSNYSNFVNKGGGGGGGYDLKVRGKQNCKKMHIQNPV